MTEEMDNQKQLYKKKLTVRFSGRGMTLSLKRIIKSLKDIAASQQMTVHLQVIVQGHKPPFIKGWGLIPQTLWIVK